MEECSGTRSSEARLIYSGNDSQLALLTSLFLWEVGWKSAHALGRLKFRLM